MQLPGGSGCCLELWLWLLLASCRLLPAALCRRVLSVDVWPALILRSPVTPRCCVKQQDSASRTYGQGAVPKKGWENGLAAGYAVECKVALLLSGPAGLLVTERQGPV